MSNLARKLPQTPPPVSTKPGKTATDEHASPNADTTKPQEENQTMPVTLEQVLISLANVRTDFAERNEAITEKLAQIAAENAKRDRERDRIASERDQANAERHQANEERLIKLEAATKQAIAELKIEIANSIKWIAGIALALSIAVIGVLGYWNNNATPSSAPSTIIYTSQLPASPTPAPSTTTNNTN